MIKLTEALKNELEIKGWVTLLAEAAALIGCALTLYISFVVAGVFL